MFLPILTTQQVADVEMTAIGQCGLDSKWTCGTRSMRGDQFMSPPKCLKWPMKVQPYLMSGVVGVKWQLDQELSTPIFVHASQLSSYQSCKLPKGNSLRLMQIPSVRASDARGYWSLLSAFQNLDGSQR
jgi:hypothetical protein